MLWSNRLLSDNYIA